MSYSKLSVEGPAPFRESGVYEVQISIIAEEPSEDQIKNKTFSSLWSGNYHLRVKNGRFSETLGTGDNQIPDSVFTYDKVWVVVNDLLSSLYSIFDVTIGAPLKPKETPVEEKPIPQ